LGLLSEIPDIKFSSSFKSMPNASSINLLKCHTFKTNNRNSLASLLLRWQLVKNPILDVQKTKTVANQDTIHYKTHNILQKQNKPTILSTIKNQDNTHKSKTDTNFKHKTNNPQGQKKNPPKHKQSTHK
jgi:hypothetical protein